ncbi:hypothetical protein HK103_004475 [Boothiomyces macroporosus]|uniref:Uncharacterized protein n=1 Tax=Boothiomyces macroporosus TaxID=261099 RepID=A0AAD5UGK6_9FUNG|nr:hypothetical protein HK103_004475 [Boothiomyces macroporosus]
MISLLSENDYQILIYLGKVSPSREEAAKCLSKDNIDDAKTLFRANSMASKALDVYMKFVATGCTLKDIFYLIQSAVAKKFPGNDIVPYTSVSGFIFLRFFAPAILGPSLFGLKVGILDPPSSRKLLLIAKTLQNLSNLVEFGQKEPFMEPMNAFITGKISDMKKFIDQISVEDKTPPESKDYSSEVLAKEAAELHVILSQAMEKMQSIEPKCTLLGQLQEEISAIDAKLKLAEDKEKTIKYDVAQDMGIDEVDKDAPSMEMGKIETTDEKKIMRMLTRCPSTDSLDSSSPGERVSIGGYKNSSEVRESMIRSPLYSQPVLPVTFVSAESSNSLIPTISHQPPSNEPSPATLGPAFTVAVDADEDSQPLEELAGPPIRKRATTRNRGISFRDGPRDQEVKKEDKKEELKKEDTLKSNPSTGSIGGRRQSTFFGIGASSEKAEKSSSPILLRRQSTLLTPDMDVCQCRSDSKTEREKGKTAKEENATCPNCGKPQGGKSNQFLKRMSFKVRMRSGTNLGAQPVLNICAKCNKEFSEGDGPIIVENRSYHQGCLVCSLCKTVISESIFSLKDDIVCKGCYFIEAHLICHECTRPILKEYIIIDGKKFHASCKTCNVSWI